MSDLAGQPLVQLTLAKIRLQMREHEVLFWVFLFPVLLAGALGVAFRNQGESEIRVAVVASAGTAEVLAALEAADGIDARGLEESAAREALRKGKVAIAVAPGEPVQLWFDPTREDSRIARLAVYDAIQRDAGREDVVGVDDREIRDPGSRYIDFLLPGLLGMNLMGTGMWGIGFEIAGARERGVLKRLAATPMRRSDYLISQILGRLVFLVMEVGLLVGFGLVAFGVPQHGAWTTFGIACLVGASAFAGIGLLCAALPRTIQGVSGVLNLAMLPMWILSGIFFSTSRFPDAMQPVVQALPLTALIEALREIMLGGATLAAVAPELTITAVWGVVAFLLALRLFRWT